MVNSPEVWAFILANSILFIMGSILLVLSFYAYYLNPKESSYRSATIGFVFIVLGGLVEPMVRFGIRSNYELTSNERLLLQSGEGIVLALGLGLLFYAITRHNADSSVDDQDLSEIHFYGFNK